MRPRSPPQPGGVESSPLLWELWLESWACVPNLWLMVFESFAHVPVTEELLQHVWEGEADGHQGGHRCGLGREGKTEFPEDWTWEHVRVGIEMTLAKPQWIRKAANKTTMFRQVSHVVVVVVVKSKAKGHYIFTAYPMSGAGVLRNQQGIKVLLPLELPKWES